MDRPRIGLSCTYDDNDDDDDDVVDDDDDDDDGGINVDDVKVAVSGLLVSCYPPTVP